MQVYSDPSRESDPHALPNVEIFYQSKFAPAAYCNGDGWYYWFCFPGYMPDSDPIGPFATAELAQQAAQEDSE